jgi:hypothetical protein
MVWYRYLNAIPLTAWYRIAILWYGMVFTSHGMVWYRYWIFTMVWYWYLIVIPYHGMVFDYNTVVWYRIQIQYRSVAD